jgi:hypothetical protein
LYINGTDTTSNYLKDKTAVWKKHLRIGAKVISYAKGKKQFKELQTTRGFQSSSEPIVHFGYGKVRIIDSLVVVARQNTSNN